MRIWRYLLSGDLATARLGVKWPICFAVLIFASGCGFGGYGRYRGGEGLEPVYHRVTSGESLYRISQRYGVSQDQVARLNGIHNPQSLQVGTRLLIGYHGSRGVITANGTQEVQAVSYRGGGNATGRIFYDGGKIGWPLRQGTIVSKFGPRSGSFHDGIDIAAPQGTPVYAAHAGTVVYSDNGLSGYGNLVIIRAPDGMTTVYAHNRRLLARVGDRVRRGDKISEVGSTGRSSGPHLHFEVRVRDIKKRYLAVDPLPLLTSSKQSYARFRQNERLTPLLVGGSAS